MNHINITVSSDPSFLGESATSADVERFAAAVEAAVETECSEAYGEVEVRTRIAATSGKSADIDADMAYSTFEGIAEPSDAWWVARRALESQVNAHVHQIADRVYERCEGW